MNYKNVISALFYLNESKQYLPPQHQLRVSAQIQDLLQQAYEETGVMSFKLFLEMCRFFPDLDLHSAKRNLQKTNVSFYFRSDYEGPIPHYLTPLPNNDQYYQFNETIACMRGAAHIQVRLAPNYDNRLSFSVNFDKCKTFSLEELERVVARLHELGAR